MRELNWPDQSAGWSSTWYFGHDSHGRLLRPGRYPIIVVASNAKDTATTRMTLTISSP
jgi:hypothetical protein